jgi:pilus assembly protein CpaB
MKKKLLPLLGIAFVVAVISTGIFYGLIAGKLRRASEGSQVQILVAAESLERGTVLGKSHMRLAAWRAAELPKGAFTTVDGAAGLTVLQPIEEGQPITQASLSSRDAIGPEAQAIPAGMRAVSIRVADSPGIVNALHSGNRVDVQVVRSRNTPNGAEPELHTVLQNMDVLAVQTDSQQGRPGGAGAVVTLLAKPPEADILSVADAGARIRLLLRNPADKEKPAMPRLELAALFQSAAVSHSPQVMRASLETKPSPVPVRALAEGNVSSPQIALSVRIAGAGAAALEEMSARLLAPRRPNALQVAAFRQGWDLESAVQRFQAGRLLDVLSASTLLAGNHREVGVQAGAQWTPAPDAAPGQAGVKVQFLPSIGPHGKLRLRVQPEITSWEGQRVATRKIDTEVELADGQSFLVAGLGEPRGRGSLVARLFPNRSPENANEELVVLVTPQLVYAGHGGRRTAALLNK